VCSRYTSLYRFQIEAFTYLLTMASVSTVQCTRCGAAGHVAAQCTVKSFMRPLCTKCNRMGHTADRCPHEARVNAAQLKAAREAEKVERDASNQQRLAAMTCFKCGLQGHSRAACPWTDEEARDLRRAERQAAMKCFKCGEIGHSKAECPSNATDTSSTASELFETVSEVSKASTVATCVDLPAVKPEPRVCSFCHATQTQVRARKGVKVCRDRCQSCWRSISGKT
jgi:ribosome modulation factor